VTSAPPGPPPPPSTKKPPKGTFRPYTIKGETYYPIQSGEGYQQTGIASWYGRDFHGKPTACGEIYDMNAMTAAHKILPMYTRLMVTNLENGKSVYVRINDRGPFVRSRIIDLSYAAATRLGMADQGVARVRIQSVGGVPGKIDGDLKGEFMIQVGSFSVPANATRLETELKRQGYTVRLVPALIRGQTFWRVQVGRYPLLSRATAQLERWRERYPDAFVIATARPR
jgi:rare lipoprotein A